MILTIYTVLTSINLHHLSLTSLRFSVKREQQRFAISPGMGHIQAAMAHGVAPNIFTFSILLKNHFLGHIIALIPFIIFPKKVFDFSGPSAASLSSEDTCSWPASCHSLPSASWLSLGEEVSPILSRAVSGSFPDSSSDSK